MPNLGLSVEEGRQILEYLTAEDRRVTRVEGNDGLASRQGEEVPDCCQKGAQTVLARDSEGTTDAATEPAQPAAVAAWAGPRVEYLLGSGLLLIGFFLRRFRA